MANRNTRGAGDLLWLGLAAGLVLWSQRHRLRRGQFAKMQNAKALITGASSGIGAEFARQLAARGYDLILVARRTERLQALAGELKARHGVEVEILTADLTKYEDVQRVAERIAAENRLELLVNNAGFGQPEPFAQSHIERQLDMIRLHDIATVALTRAALPGMINRQHGGVIITSSTAAFVPLFGNANYSASKAYLNSFAETIAGELEGTGVAVQALCPGFIITEFHDEMTDTRSKLPAFLWMQASDVVRDSLEALGSDEVIVIPGWMYKLVSLFGRSLLTHGLAKWGARMFVRRGSQDIPLS